MYFMCPGGFGRCWKALGGSICCILHVWKALGGSMCRILRVWKLKTSINSSHLLGFGMEGSGKLNLSYFTCQEGSGKFNLPYFTCLEGSGRLNLWYSLRCAPARRPSLFLSVLLSEKVIARASLTSAHSRLRRSWPYLIPNRYLMPNRYAHPGLLGFVNRPDQTCREGGNTDSRGNRAHEHLDLHVIKMSQDVPRRRER